jgi:hypothetical protein
MVKLSDLKVYVDLAKRLDYSHQDNAKSSGVIWYELFTALVARKIQNSERVKRLNFITSKYDLMISEARKNKLHLAKQLLKEVESIPRVYFSEEENLFLNCFAFPANAYLKYKQSMFEEALTGLFDTLKMDELLEGYGYNLLQYHRVQQLHNICRIYFRTRQFDKAVFSSNELLRYLMLNEQPTSFPGSWKINLLDLAPAQFRSAMIFQVLEEAHFNSIIMSNKNFEGQMEIHSRMFSNLDNFSPQTKDDESIKMWLSIKSLLHCGDYNDFISNAITFLLNESSKFDSLKHSLVNDILYVLSLIDRDDIRNELINILNQYLNEKLKLERNLIPVIV